MGWVWLNRFWHSLLALQLLLFLSLAVGFGGPPSRFRLIGEYKEWFTQDVSRDGKLMVQTAGQNKFTARPGEGVTSVPGNFNVVRIVDVETGKEVGKF